MREGERFERQNELEMRCGEIKQRLIVIKWSYDKNRVYGNGGTKRECYGEAGG